MILAFETSCDDTCAALIDWEGQVRANVISSQAVHERFGGVVPEIASRHHLELLEPVLEQALREAQATLVDVSLVAATQGPGLIGALLVGLSFGKGLAAARGLPFAPVDHLQGHVAANFLGASFEPPFVCLIASGGHTLMADVRDHEGFEVLGRAQDDAAGEAFDKGARMLGLGYPGGPPLERLARSGDPEAFQFSAPGARGRPGRGAGKQAFEQSLDFSFAGLKTALMLRVRDLSPGALEAQRADLAASYQRAIVESLVGRSEQALELTGLDRLAIGGGVACNGPLRERLSALGVELHVPAPILCTDNAAMIASAARFGERLEHPDYLALDAYATGERPLAGSGQRTAQ